MGGFKRDYMPKLLQDMLKDNMTLSSTDGIDEEGMVLLAQWSDLIVFDFITGNYDRVASMQDAADKESKPEIMSENIHNVVKDDGGKLWFIDNESGLVDAYKMMYEDRSQRFINFHREM